MRVLRVLRDERGSATAEFTMVAGLLTVLVLSVMQIALALHVRTTLADAAAEGARFASLVGSDPAAGVDRARALVSTAIGAEYARDIRASVVSFAGLETIQVRIVAPMPVLGLVGPIALDVTGHAPVERYG